MSKYIINGGRRLDGELRIGGAKNSVLPLLAASILTDEKIILHDCPAISDVDNMLKIITSMGCVVSREGSSLEIDAQNVFSGDIPPELAKELRSSIFLMGPILARLRRAKVAYPGGCDIGMRPIDIHLRGFRELNIDISEEYGYIYCDATNMRAADIVLDIPSVGATENLIMASVCLKGTTIIRNAAKEPEIVDLQNLLNKMGAKVSGAGNSVIVVEGVKKLHSAEHTPISDRIAAGTFIVAAAMCGGKISLLNVNAEHNCALLSKFSKTACNIDIKNDKIIIQSSCRPPAFDTVETMYYPGFPTDLQAQMMALMTVAKGSSVLIENIFESRFKQVPEFRKMGAQITVSGRAAVIRGVPYLKGAEVTAYDLRGGAALTVAGLAARGVTLVKDIYHIDRGYENFELALNALGADIKRIE